MRGQHRRIRRPRAKLRGPERRYTQSARVTGGHQRASILPNVTNCPPKARAAGLKICVRRELTQRYCGEVPPAPRRPLAVGSPPPFALSLADGRGRDDAAQRGEFARGSSRGRARTKLGAPPHPRPTPRRSLTCARASLAGGGGRVPPRPDVRGPRLLAVPPLLPEVGRQRVHLPARLLQKSADDTRK